MITLFRCAALLLTLLVCRFGFGQDYVVLVPADKAPTAGTSLVLYVSTPHSILDSNLPLRLSTTPESDHKFQEIAAVQGALRSTQEGSTIAVSHDSSQAFQGSKVRIAGPHDLKNLSPTDKKALFPVRIWTDKTPPAPPPKPNADQSQQVGGAGGVLSVFAGKKGDSKPSTQNNPPKTGTDAPLWPYVVGVLVIGAGSSVAFFLWVRSRREQPPDKSFTTPNPSPSLSKELQQIHSRLGDFNTRLGEFQTALINLKDVPELARWVANQVQPLNERLAKVEERLTTLDRTVGGLTSGLPTLTNSVQNSTTRTETALGSISSQVKEDVGRIGETTQRHMTEFSGNVTKSLDAMGSKVWPAVHRDGASVADRIQSVRTEIEGLLRSPSIHPMDDAFLRECAKESDELLKIARDIEASGSSWQPPATQLDSLAAVFQPVRRIDPSSVSATGASMLATLRFRIDEIRRDIKTLCAEVGGLKQIEVVPGKTKFDSELHDDTPSTRMSSDDPRFDHVIYESIKPGFTLKGRVTQKAHVKQYITSSAVSAQSPSPSSKPEPTHVLPVGSATGEARGSAGSQGSDLTAPVGARAPVLGDTGPGRDLSDIAQANEARSNYSTAYLPIEIPDGSPDTTDVGTGFGQNPGSVSRETPPVDQDSAAPKPNIQPRNNPPLQTDLSQIGEGEGLVAKASEEAPQDDDQDGEGPQANATETGGGSPEAPIADLLGDYRRSRGQSTGGA